MQRYGITYYNKITGRNLSGGGWFLSKPEDKEKQAADMVAYRTGFKYKKSLLNRIRTLLTGYKIYTFGETESVYCIDNQIKQIHEESSEEMYTARDVYGNIVRIAR